MNLANNYQAYYYAADILLKVILGVVVVIYINKRNNQVKKKEILYDLYLNLIKNRQGIMSSYNSYFEYYAYKLLKVDLNFDNETFSSSQENEIYLIIDDKMHELEEEEKNFIKCREEFYRVCETIDLILGLKKHGYVDGIAKNLHISYYCFVNGEVVLNDSYKEFFKKFKEYSIGLINNYISKREFFDMVNSEMTHLNHYSSYNLKLLSENMVKHNNFIKKKIDRL